MYKIITFFLLLSGCSTVNNNVEFIYYNVADKKCMITDIALINNSYAPKEMITNKMSRKVQDEIIAKYIITLKDNLVLTEAQLKRIKDSLLQCEYITVIK
jgi:hypothetical protein